MVQGELSNFKEPEEKNSPHISGVKYIIDTLVNTSTPPERRLLLKLLAKGNRNILLTREQTSIFLNIRLKRIDELAESGKLLRNEDGYFRTGEVFDYKLEKRNREKRGLEEMAEIDNFDPTSNFSN